jgi:hypothetical protein
MLAAMAMQWTVARAVTLGLIKDQLPFVRTAKGGIARRALTFPAFNETLLGGALVIGAIVVFTTNYEHVREINLFGCVLLVQSVPFLAATALAVFEDSRFNSFAFWRGLEMPMALRSLPLRNPVVVELAVVERTAVAELAVAEAAHTVSERVDAQQMATP